MGNLTDMKKIITLILIFFINSNISFASNIKIISSNQLFNTATIAVSVKDVKNENTLYKINDTKLLHPASTLKLLTIASVIDILKDNYEYKTQIFVDKSNNWYIKLSGDPLFSTDNLKSLIKQTKKSGFKNPNKIYIDVSKAFDDKTSGTGWMSDDNTNCFTPYFSSYNIDSNCINLNITINQNSQKPQITYNNAYKINFINNLKTGANDNFNFYRSNLYNDDFIIFEGIVKNNQNIKIPVLNPKRNFIAKLDNLLKKENINYYDNYEIKETPYNAKLAACHTTSVSALYPLALKNSNNLVTETLFKTSGKERLKANLGTFEDGKTAFYDFYINKLNLNPNYRQLKLEDASGVSRNNLITADFTTDALIQLEKNSNLNFRNYLAKGNQGTLTNRFVDIRDNIWAKTGTLDGISALSGYILDANNNLIAFSIMIQNYTEDDKEAKKLEDEIIYSIYRGEIK